MAIGFALEIQAFYIMGGSHDAAPIRAVAKTQCMAQFVDGFLHQPVPEHIFVCWEAVKLFAKTMQRDNGAAAHELRFTKDEGKDWDVQIHVRDS